MQYKKLGRLHKAPLVSLFTSTFSESEGLAEGQALGRLSAELADAIDEPDICCFGACTGEALVGAIFFSALHFKKPISVYMLSPVAVGTAYQRQGIGHTLIEFGLNELRKRRVSVVVTYGDPAFYSTLAFSPLSEETLKAPMTLSMPEGWQGLNLKGGEIATVAGQPACAKPFQNSAYW